MEKAGLSRPRPRGVLPLLGCGRIGGVRGRSEVGGEEGAILGGWQCE